MTQIGIRAAGILSVHDHSTLPMGGGVAVGSLIGHNTAVHDAMALHHGDLSGRTDDDHERYFDKDGSKAFDGLLRYERQIATIASGEITAEKTFIAIETEGGIPLDEVDRINDGFDGKIIYLTLKDSSHNVILKHLTGNIANQALGDILLDTHSLVAIYMYKEGWWRFITLSNMQNKDRIDLLGISHASLSDNTPDDHHTLLHEALHRLGGSDELNHDHLAGVVIAEHKSLPNTLAEVLNDHNKAAHDALNIDADTVDGEEAAAIVTDARVKAHFPDTIAAVLNDHDRAAHDALNILHSDLGGLTTGNHHAKNHEGLHRLGGGDELSHDHLAGVVIAEHKSLPNTLAEVLNDHNKAAHDALNIDADTVDGEEAAAIVTDARVKAHFPDTISAVLNDHNKAAHDALNIDADTVDSEHVADIVTDGRVKAHFPDNFSNIISDHDIESGSKLSDNVKFSNDGTQSTSSGTMTEVKKITCNQDIGKIRVKFSLRTTGMDEVYAKVYVNGSPVGNEEMSDTGAWDVFEHDFVSLNNGDIISIYAKVGVGDSAEVKEMRVCYDIGLFKIGGAELNTPLPVVGLEEYDFTTNF